MNPSTFAHIAEQAKAENNGENKISYAKLNKFLDGVGCNTDQIKDFRKLCDRINNNYLDLGPVLELDGGEVQMPTFQTQQPQVAASVSTPQQTQQVNTQKMQLQSFSNDEVHIPAKNPLFVAWGDYPKLKKIISTKRFFPVFIAGESGGGKTANTKQACAELKRHYIRVQINNETTEDDLIGGLRLIDGDTVFVKGPVLKAMEAGAVLLLDEIDRGTDLLLCLQGILEGTEYLVKKTGEVIHPAEGFTVVATGNSKGRGDESGKYASNILDDALLERFRILLSQPIAPIAVEKKIMEKKMRMEGCFVKDELEKLALWIDTIRKSYDEGTIGANVSTRRSTAIIEAFAIFENMEEAIEMSISRYEDEDVAAMLEFYKVATGGNEI